MDDLIEEIIFNYNNAIEGLCIDSRDLSPLQNKMICSIENVLGQSIGQRISLIDHRRPGKQSREPNSDDIEENMFELMCGCRLSAKIIFTMLYLGISIPNKMFYKKYKQFFENHNYASSIFIYGIRADDLIRNLPGPQRKIFVLNHLNQYSPIYGRMVIGQILKQTVDTGILFSPYHTFIIVINDDESCNVISSWFDGNKESLVTNKVKSLEELQKMLTIESLLNEEVCAELFGEGNKLFLSYRESESNYEILFVTQKQIENDRTKEKRSLGSRSSSESRNKKRQRKSGRKSSGRKSSGRKSSGRKRSGRKSSGRKSSGRKSSGRKSSGRKSSGRKSGGK